LEIIKPTKKINYVRCKMCLFAFKLKRRNMKNPQDLYIYEISYTDGETPYAVKGHHISNETLIKNRNKFNIDNYYSDYFISEDEFSIIN
jgi:hypothetical protein